MAADLYSLAESAVGGSADDQLSLYRGLIDQLTLLNSASGNSMLNPTNGAQSASTKPPSAGTIAVSAANGTYVVQITPASQSISATIYQEVSYSPIKNFGAQVTTLDASTSTHYTIPFPGGNLFIRFRSSYDKSTWNSYTLATQTAVASGLQSSAASEPNTPLNISNYAFVDSVDAGATANVRVFGAAGPYTQYAGVKGAVETILPSATIVNAEHGATDLVAYDGEQYAIKPTLPGVFPDTNTPIGQVSVVGSGSPTLPIITPVISGGHIIGATFTPGSGLTQAPTLTVADTGGGTGAVIIAIISGGVMTGYNLQAVGQGYTGATTITASGGIFSGATGGGQTAGGNGGRLTKV